MLRILLALLLGFLGPTPSFAVQTVLETNSLPKPTERNREHIISWEEIATAPLATVSPSFVINGQKVNLLDDLPQILRYYQTRQPYAYTTRWLKQQVYWTRNERAGKAMLENHQLQYGDYAPVSFSIPALKWNENPFSSLNWQWLHHQLISVHFLVAYAKKQHDPGAVEAAKAIVRSWAEANYKPSFPSPQSWNDHSTAYRLRTLLCLFEHLRADQSLDLDFTGDLLRMIDSHCRVLADERFFSRHTNHGFDQAVILFWAAKAFPELSGASQWLQVSQGRLRDEIAYMFTQEGVHVENSPNYHTWLLGALEEVTVLTDETSSSGLDWVLNDGWEYAAYALEPKGRFPLVGDDDAYDFSQAHSSLSFPGCLHFLYSASGGKAGTKPIMTDRVFPLSGYAVFRDAWHEPDTFKDTIFLFFKCGFLSNYHRHDDDLNFVLSALGQQWVIDSGLYGYDEDHPIRRYMLSVYAHNTVVVTGAQVIRDVSEIPAPGSGIIEHGIEKNRSFVTGRSLMYRGYTVERRLEYLKPYSIVINDSVAVTTNGSPALPDFSVLFHIPSDKTVTVLPDNQVVISSTNSDRLLLAVKPSPVRIKVISGKGDGTMSGCSWVSEKMAEFQASQCLRVELSGTASSTCTLTLSPANRQAKQDR
jgi:hypothetical protein